MAYLFNGTNQYMTAALDSFSGIPCTLSCWINVSVVPSIILPILVLTNSTTNARVNINTDGANITAAGIDANGNSTGNAFFVNAISASRWIHVCAVHQSSNRNIYINGVAGTVNTATLSSFSANRLLIATNFSFNLFFGASIADVGVWNAALDTEEISAIAKGFACNLVRTQNLVFYAPLIRNIVDIKGNSNIINNNSATIFNHPRIYY